MKESHIQPFNGILIIIGAVLLAYSLIVTGDHRYIQIAGLAILLIGTYRASSYWSKHKDDHLDE